ncbi:PREDICTED: uncharacterized protein LOC101293531 [Fragaria vesca subsp. vesca]|uniref:uncharacterized protein LOC101293531 n=1 Tax=Fragaria vesca subsp. vesca TaxID=101020 RepID=UPI0002C30E2E|nr:PREDICTED: uncharacterized protein LOC101293531 [Fragaria vesca subsp. vesca]
MWTINDFPGYGYMSGWCTQGRLACPCCASETPSHRLKNGKRQCYMRNCRFLAPDHKWRKQRKAFDNTKEMKYAPKRQSGQEIVDQLQNLGAVEPGDNQENQVIPGFGKTHNWKKISIPFRLPYWKTLMLRHNLDVMHIEKNIFDNVVGTMMNIDRKTKDSLNARHDLQAMGIRKDYWPREEDGKLVYDRAPFKLSADDIKVVCEWLLKLKVPDGYCANISHWVNDKRRGLTGMKTHDCHVFLKRLLSLVVRELLAKEPCEALIELSYFFKELCAKNLNVSDLELLDNQIATTLCKLEMIFPPAFFTIMVHLSIHLAREAKVAGLVQYRWMYLIERYLHKLNTYVRNKAHLEGSMAEGYLAEEEHKDILRIQYGDDQVDQLHKKIFVKWFSERIEQLYAEGKESAQMFSLAQGSGKQAVYYKGYNIHGFRFHTEQHDENKKTQNSGVMVKGEKEINCVPWYGTITDIVELWYIDQNKVILFHCNWFDTATKGKGYKEDRYGILSVNNKGKLNTQEPFVLASQATQVYYVEGIKNSTWSVVVETKPRNVFEMPTDEEEPYQQEESQTSHTYANRNVEEDDEE